MKWYSSVSLLLFLIIVLSSATSCTRNNAQDVEKIPAVALKGAGAVYSTFTDYLSKGPRDNDFTKFASNPENFTVSIRDRGDKFVYTFVLRPYHGGPVLDGMISYSLSKEDGKIERTPNH